MVAGNRPHVLCSQKTGIKVALRFILLFDPGRAILPSRPQISRAVVSSGSQGRRFFSAAEGLSLTAASTMACFRAFGLQSITSSIRSSSLTCEDEEPRQ